MNSIQKTFVVLALIVTSTPAFATSLIKPTTPSVSCEMSYSETDAKGISVVYQRGENLPVVPREASTTKNGIYTLKAVLVPICAADANFCTGSYTLTAEISSGDVSSVFYATVSPDSYDRASGSLNIKNKHAFVNCDYGSNQ